MFGIWKSCSESAVFRKWTLQCLLDCRWHVRPPPYLAVLLCNEVKSVEQSLQLREGPGMRLSLIRVTAELLVLI